MWWERHFTPVIFFPQPHNLSLITGKTTDTSWLWDTVRTSGEFLKMVKVMRNKERQWNCHSTEETGEMWQLNECGMLDWILERTRILMEKWWNSNEVWILVNSNMPVSASSYSQVCHRRCQPGGNWVRGSQKRMYWLELTYKSPKLRSLCLKHWPLEIKGEILQLPIYTILISPNFHWNHCSSP